VGELKITFCVLKVEINSDDEFKFISISDEMGLKLYILLLPRNISMRKNSNV
jgi:hypothetical protein